MKRSWKRILAGFLAACIIFGDSSLVYAAESTQPVVETSEPGDVVVGDEILEEPVSDETDEIVTEEQPVAEETTEIVESESEEETEEDVLQDSSDNEMNVVEPTEEVVNAAAKDSGAPETSVEEPEIIQISAQQEVYVNPLYEDVVSEEDILSEVSAVMPVEELDTYTNGEEIVEMVREELVARTETIAFAYEYEGVYDADGIMGSLVSYMDEAMKHTGNPKEGDYLKWNYAGNTYGISGGYSQGDKVYVELYYSMVYYTSAEMEAEMDEAVSILMNTLHLDNMSEYKQIKKIYDFICENVVYDYENLENEEYKLKYTPYAALINGTAVCQGYAMLFYRVALEAGIDARVITGDAGGPHAWNIVELEEQYYNLDSTWDAGRGTYSYFLKDMAGFTDHVREEEYLSESFMAAYPMTETAYDEPVEVYTGTVEGDCLYLRSWELMDTDLAFDDELILNALEARSNESFSQIIICYPEGYSQEIPANIWNKLSDMLKDSEYPVGFCFSGLNNTMDENWFVTNLSETESAVKLNAELTLGEAGMYGSVIFSNTEIPAENAWVCFNTSHWNDGTESGGKADYPEFVAAFGTDNKKLELINTETGAEGIWASYVYSSSSPGNDNLNLEVNNIHNLVENVVYEFVDTNYDDGDEIEEIILNEIYNVEASEEWEPLYFDYLFTPEVDGYYGIKGNASWIFVYDLDDEELENLEFSYMRNSEVGNLEKYYELEAGRTYQFSFAVYLDVDQSGFYQLVKDTEGDNLPILPTDGTVYSLEAGENKTIKVQSSKRGLYKATVEGGSYGWEWNYTGENARAADDSIYFLSADNAYLTISAYEDSLTVKFEEVQNFTDLSLESDVEISRNVDSCYKVDTEEVDTLYVKSKSRAFDLYGIDSNGNVWVLEKNWLYEGNYGEDSWAILQIPSNTREMILYFPGKYQHEDESVLLTENYQVENQLSKWEGTITVPANSSSLFEYTGNFFGDLYFSELTNFNWEGIDFEVIDTNSEIDVLWNGDTLDGTEYKGFSYRYFDSVPIGDSHIIFRVVNSLNEERSFQLKTNEDFEAWELYDDNSGHLDVFVNESYWSDYGDTYFSYYKIVPETTKMYKFYDADWIYRVSDHRFMPKLVTILEAGETYLVRIRDEYGVPTENIIETTGKFVEFTDETRLQRFIPTSSGNYQIEVDGNLYLWNEEEVCLESIDNNEIALEEGESYIFLAYGNGFIGSKNKIHILDYDFLNAFIASGGSVSLNADGSLNIEQRGAGWNLISKIASFFGLVSYEEVSKETYIEANNYWVNEEHGSFVPTEYYDLDGNDISGEEAEDGGYVVVKYEPEYVWVDRFEMDLADEVLTAGESTTLKITPYAATEKYGFKDEPEVRVMTSDPEIANFLPDGTVETYKAGTVLITAYADETLKYELGLEDTIVKKSVVITVEPKSEDVVLEYTGTVQQEGDGEVLYIRSWEMNQAGVPFTDENVLSILNKRIADGDSFAQVFINYPNNPGSVDKDIWNAVKTLMNNTEWSAGFLFSNGNSKDDNWFVAGMQTATEDVVLDVTLDLGDAGGCGSVSFANTDIPAEDVHIRMNTAHWNDGTPEGTGGRDDYAQFVAAFGTETCELDLIKNEIVLEDASVRYEYYSESPGNDNLNLCVDYVNRLEAGVVYDLAKIPVLVVELSVDAEGNVESIVLKNTDSKARNLGLTAKTEDGGYRYLGGSEVEAGESYEVALSDIADKFDDAKADTWNLYAYCEDIETFETLEEVKIENYSIEVSRENVDPIRISVDENTGIWHFKDYPLSEYSDANIFIGPSISSIWSLEAGEDSEVSDYFYFDIEQTKNDMGWSDYVIENIIFVKTVAGENSYQIQQYEGTEVEFDVPSPEEPELEYTGTVQQDGDSEILYIRSWEMYAAGVAFNDANILAILDKRINDGDTFDQVFIVNHQNNPGVINKDVWNAVKTLMGNSERSAGFSFPSEYYADVNWFIAGMQTATEDVVLNAALTLGAAEECGSVVFGNTDIPAESADIRFNTTHWNDGTVTGEKNDYVQFVEAFGTESAELDIMKNGTPAEGGSAKYQYYSESSGTVNLNLCVDFVNKLEANVAYELTKKTTTRPYTGTVVQEEDGETLYIRYWEVENEGGTFDDATILSALESWDRTFKQIMICYPEGYSTTIPADIWNAVIEHDDVDDSSNGFLFDGGMSMNVNWYVADMETAYGPVDLNASVIVGKDGTLGTVTLDNTENIPAMDVHVRFNSSKWKDDGGEVEKDDYQSIVDVFGQEDLVFDLVFNSQIISDREDRYEWYKSEDGAHYNINADICLFNVGDLEDGSYQMISKQYDFGDESDDTFILNKIYRTGTSDEWQDLYYTYYFIPEEDGYYGVKGDFYWISVCPENWYDLEVSYLKCLENGEIERYYYLESGENYIFNFNIGVEADCEKYYQLVKDTEGENLPVITVSGEPYCVGAGKESVIKLQVTEAGLYFVSIDGDDYYSQWEEIIGIDDYATGNVIYFAEPGYAYLKIDAEEDATVELKATNPQTLSINEEILVPADTDVCYEVDVENHDVIFIKKNSGGFELVGVDDDGAGQWIDNYWIDENDENWLIVQTPSEMKKLMIFFEGKNQSEDEMMLVTDNYQFENQLTDWSGTITVPANGDIYFEYTGDVYGDYFISEPLNGSWDDVWFESLCESKEVRALWDTEELDGVSYKGYTYRSYNSDKELQSHMIFKIFNYTNHDLTFELKTNEDFETWVLYDEGDGHTEVNVNYNYYDCDYNTYYSYYTFTPESTGLYNLHYCDWVYRVSDRRLLPEYNVVLEAGEEYLIRFYDTYGMETTSISECSGTDVRFTELESIKMFNPTVSGDYHIEVPGTLRIWNKETLRFDNITTRSMIPLEAGETYIFWSRNGKGQIGLKNDITVLDYDYYQALIASGGSVTIVDGELQINKPLFGGFTLKEVVLSLLGITKYVDQPRESFMKANQYWVGETGTFAASEYYRLSEDGTLTDCADDSVTAGDILVVKYEPEIVWVDSMEVSVENTVLSEGNTAQINVNVAPATEKYGFKEAPEIRFESSDPTVAEVDENGVVIPYKSGKVTITVYADETLRYQEGLEDQILSQSVELTIVGKEFTVLDYDFLQAFIASGGSVSLNADGSLKIEQKKAGWNLISMIASFFGMKTYEEIPVENYIEANHYWVTEKNESFVPTGYYDLNGNDISKEQAEAGGYAVVKYEPEYVWVDHFDMEVEDDVLTAGESTTLKVTPYAATEKYGFKTEPEIRLASTNPEVADVLPDGTIETYKSGTVLIKAYADETLKNEMGLGHTIVKDHVVITVEPAPVTFTYEILDDGTACITGYEGIPSKVVEIPSEIDGYQVTAIGELAFLDCTDLDRVVLPDSIESIHDLAFKYQEEDYYLNLDIMFYASRESYAYGWAKDNGYKVMDPAEGPYSLEYEDNGDGTITITNYVGDLPSELTIPSTIDGYTVTGIGFAAFMGCTELTQLVIPDCVSTIDNAAFRQCSNLKKVTLPEEMYSIGSFAFGECTELEELILPEGITYLANAVIWECDSLISITLPDGVETIEFHAISHCDNLEEVIIPDSVTMIAEYGIFNCPKLKKVELPNSIESIGEFTFYQGDLEEDSETYERMDITIYASRKHYAYEWANDRGFTVVDSEKNPYEFIYESTDEDPITWKITGIDDGTASGNLAIPETIDGIKVTEVSGLSTDNIKGEFSGTLTLPSTLRVIHDNAFQGNSKLTGTVVIPSGVTYVGADAFEGTGLTIKVECEENSYLHDWAKEHGYEYEIVRFVCDNFVYEVLEDNTAKILGCKEFDGDTLTIPAKLAGHAVSEIGAYAFENYENLCELRLECEETLKSIGNYAFRNCSSLWEFEIPENVASIGNGAFYGTGDWWVLEIPESVTSIGEEAFGEVSSIYRVYLPENVTYIGDNAFSVRYFNEYNKENILLYCANGSYAYEWAVKNEYHIYDATAEREYQLTYTVLDKEAKTVAITGYTGEAGGTLAIPAEIDGYTVAEIADCAFDAEQNMEEQGMYSDSINFTGLELPDTLVRIGNQAFQSCKGLTGNLVIPDRVKEIGAGAFWGCDDLNGALIIPNTVEKVGSNAFNGCTGFTNLSLGTGLSEIEYYAFANCRNITGELVIPENITYIADGAFVNCFNLTEVHMPDTLEYIEGMCFYDEMKYEPLDVTIYASRRCYPYKWAGEYGFDRVDTIPDQYFFTYEDIDGENVRITGIDGDAKGELIIPETIDGFTVTEISDFAFENCTGFVGKLEIPKTVNRIGGRAFKGCTGLNGTVIIPQNVYEIYEGTFFNCTGLEKVYITEYTGYINNDAFMYDLIGETGDEYEDKPLDITVICDKGSYAYEWARNLGYQIDTETALAVRFAYEVLEDGTARITKYNGMSYTDMEIPATIDGYVVSEIGDYAFEECREIYGTLSFPDSIVKIGEGAFSWCEGLNRVELPNNLRSLGEGAFFGLSDLSKVFISDSVTWIDENAFSKHDDDGGIINQDLTVYCTTGSYAWEWAVSNGFRAFDFNSNGDYQFTYDVLEDGTICITGYEGTPGKNLVIPQIVDGYTVTKIGSSAFEYGFEFSGTLLLPNTLKEIGDWAFAECENISGTMIIPESVEQIGNYAFMGCAGIEEVHVGNNIEFIGEYVFSDSEGLENLDITIHASRISYAYEWAAENNFDVVDIDAGKTVYLYEVIDNEIKTIRITGIDGKPEKDFVIPETYKGYTVTEIGDCAFSEYEEDENKFSGTLTIPNTVTSIGDHAFEACSGFTGNLVIPDSVTYMADGAFVGCSGFESVTLSNNLEIIPESAFLGMTGLKGNIVIPDKVTEIHLDAFSNCTGIVSVQIPESVTSIDSGAFYNYETESNLNIKIYCSEISYASTWAKDNGFETAVGETFEVTLVTNGGTVATDNITEYVEGIGAVLPTKVTKAGYTFGGWYTNEECTGERVLSIGKDENGNKTFYAKWTLDEYTITFHENGGSLAEDGVYDVHSKLIILPIIEREAYTFAGWYDNASFAGTKVTEIPTGSTGNRTFYAKWIPVTYTITYNVDGGTIKGEYVPNYTIEKDVVLPEIEKPHYEFEGWYTDESFTEQVTVIEKGNTGDCTFYAKWKAIEYTIEYHLNGGTNAVGNPETYTIETDTFYLQDAVRAGYEFCGWYSDKELTQYVESIDKGRSENIQLYADWKPIEYDYIYEFNDSEGSSEAYKYTAEDEVALITPSREGYEFGGWYKEKNFSGTPVEKINKGSIGDCTFYAKWTPIKYKIRYVLNDSDLSKATHTNPETYTIETATFMLENAKREGYKFRGWYEDAALNDSVDTIVKGSIEDLTLYADWEAVEYEVIYNLNGGKFEIPVDESYTIEKSHTLEIPKRDGYDFDGWYDNKNLSGTSVEEIKAGNTGNKNFYAKWTPKTYQITYELNGGTNVSGNPVSYTIETATITLKSATRTGYTFTGWYLDKECTQQITKIVKGSIEDLTLYADWKVVSYNVTYNLNGGKFESTVDTTYTFEDTLKLAVPTKKGYTFKGWYAARNLSGNEVTEIAAGTTGAKSFYAKWERNEYKINYVLNEGTNVAGNPETYHVETATFKFKNATRTGYNFTGWYSDELLTNKVTQVVKGSAEDITLYAGWELIDYKISYVLNGGTLPDDVKTSYQVIDEITLKEPTRIGYEFGGWYTNAKFNVGSEISGIAQGSTGAKTVYAKWTAVSYDIMYVDGEDIDNASYTIESKTFNLPALTKLGYKFIGWYDNSEYLGTPVKSVVKGSSGNKTFYAKWEIEKYAITYNLNKGELPEDSIYEYVISEEATALPIPTRKGYEFVGWYTTQNFKGECVADIPAGTTKAKTFYAKWNIVNYAIDYDGIDHDGITFESVLPESYTVEQTVKLPEAYRFGYDFLGWYEMKDGIKEKVTEIPAGSVDNKILCAEWNWNAGFTAEVNTDSLDTVENTAMPTIIVPYGKDEFVKVNVSLTSTIGVNILPGYVQLYVYEGEYTEDEILASINGEGAGSLPANMNANAPVGYEFDVVIDPSNGIGYQEGTTYTVAAVFDYEGYTFAPSATFQLVKGDQPLPINQEIEWEGISNLESLKFEDLVKADETYKEELIRKLFVSENGTEFDEEFLNGNIGFKGVKTSNALKSGTYTLVYEYTGNKSYEKSAEATLKVTYAAFTAAGVEYRAMDNGDDVGAIVKPGEDGFNATSYATELTMIPLVKTPSGEILAVDQLAGEGYDVNVDVSCTNINATKEDKDLLVESIEHGVKVTAKNNPAKTLTKKIQLSTVISLNNGKSATLKTTVSDFKVHSNGSDMIESIAWSIDGKSETEYIYKSDTSKRTVPVTITATRYDGSTYTHEDKSLAGKLTWSTSNKTVAEISVDKKSGQPTITIPKNAQGVTEIKAVAADSAKKEISFKVIVVDLGVRAENTKLTLNSKKTETGVIKIYPNILAKELYGEYDIKVVEADKNGNVLEADKQMFILKANDESGALNEISANGELKIGFAAPQTGKKNHTIYLKAIPQIGDWEEDEKLEAATLIKVTISDKWVVPPVSGKVTVNYNKAMSYKTAYAEVLLTVAEPLADGNLEDVLKLSDTTVPCRIDYEDTVKVSDTQYRVKLVLDSNINDSTYKTEKQMNVKFTVRCQGYLADSVTGLIKVPINSVNPTFKVTSALFSAPVFYRDFNDTMKQMKVYVDVPEGVTVTDIKLTANAEKLYDIQSIKIDTTPYEVTLIAHDSAKGGDIQFDMTCDGYAKPLQSAKLKAAGRTIASESITLYDLNTEQKSASSFTFSYGLLGKEKIDLYGESQYLTEFVKGLENEKIELDIQPDKTAEKLMNKNALVVTVKDNKVSMTATKDAFDAKLKSNVSCKVKVALEVTDDNGNVKATKAQTITITFSPKTNTTSVTLKATGNLNVADVNSVVTVKPTIKNLAVGAKVESIIFKNATDAQNFELVETGNGTFTIGLQDDGVNVPSGKNTIPVIYVIRTASGELMKVEASAAINVVQTAAIKLSETTLTLYNSVIGSEFAKPIEFKESKFGGEISVEIDEASREMLKDAGIRIVEDRKGSDYEGASDMKETVKYKVYVAEDLNRGQEKTYTVKAKVSLYNSATKKGVPITYNTSFKVKLAK